MALTPSPLQQSRQPRRNSLIEEVRRRAAEARTDTNESYFGDIGSSLATGAARLPGVATGLLDVTPSLFGIDRPVSRAADVAGAATGFRPGAWADQRGDELTPATQSALERVRAAQGFAGTGRAYLENPRAIGTLVAESLPTTVAGGFAGAGARVAATRLAARGVNNPVTRALQRPAVAGAVGEGAVGAGAAMDQIDESVDPRRAALAAVGTGAVTAGIGAAGATLARRFGLADTETVLAGGRIRLEPGERGLNLLQRTIGGGISEGVLQELPQGASEQIFQNWAEGNELFAGVDRAAVESLIAGAATGAGFGAVGVGGAPAVVDATAQDPRQQAEQPRQRFNARNLSTEQLIESHAALANIAENASQYPDLAEQALGRMEQLRRAMAARGLPEDAIEAQLAQNRYTKLARDTDQLQTQYQDAVAADPRGARGILRRIESNRAEMQAISEVQPDAPRGAAQARYNDLISRNRELADSLREARDARDGERQQEMREALAANREAIRDIRTEYSDIEFTGEQPAQQGRGRRRAAQPETAPTPATVQVEYTPVEQHLRDTYAGEDPDNLRARLFRTRDGKLRGGTDPQTPRGYYERVMGMDPFDVRQERLRLESAVQRADGEGRAPGASGWKLAVLDAVEATERADEMQGYYQQVQDLEQQPITGEEIGDILGSLELTETQTRRLENYDMLDTLRGQADADIAAAEGTDAKSVRESIDQVRNKFIKALQRRRGIESVTDAREAFDEFLASAAPRDQAAEQVLEEVGEAGTQDETVVATAADLARARESGDAAAEAELEVELDEARRRAEEAEVFDTTSERSTTATAMEMLANDARSATTARSPGRRDTSLDSLRELGVSQKTITAISRAEQQIQPLERELSDLRRDVARLERFMGQAEQYSRSPDLPRWQALWAVGAKLATENSPVQHPEVTWDLVAVDGRLLGTWVREVNDAIDTYGANIAGMPAETKARFIRRLISGINIVGREATNDGETEPTTTAALIERAREDQAAIEAELAELRESASAGRDDARTALERFARTNQGRLAEVTLEGEPPDVEGMDDAAVYYANPDYEAMQDDEADYYSLTLPRVDVRTPTTTEAIETALRRVFTSPARMRERVRIFEDVPALVQALGENPDTFPTGVQAMVRGGKVYMVRQNIQAGTEFAVLLHELGVHEGLPKILGQRRFNDMARQVVDWANQADGSPESDLAIRAMARVYQADQHARSVGKPLTFDDRRHEAIAYFVEEAAVRGIAPSASTEMQSWWRKWVTAVRRLLARWGVRTSYFSQAPAYRDAKYAFGAARDIFLDVLPEDATIDEVMDQVDDFNGPYRDFLNALDADDWLGFDYPAQAISAALSEENTRWALSQRLKRSIGRLVNLELQGELTAQRMVDLAYGAAQLEAHHAAPHINDRSPRTLFSLRADSRLYDDYVRDLPMNARYFGNTLKRYTRRLQWLFSFTHDFADQAQLADPAMGAQVAAWKNSIDQRLAMRDRLNIRVQEAVDRVTELSSRQRDQLNAFLADATIAEAWGFDAQAEGIVDEEVDVDEQLAEQFNKMNQAQQSAAIEMMRVTREFRDLLNEAVAEETMAAYDERIDRAETPEEIQQITAERDKAIRDSTRTIGQAKPSYLPLRRFGEFAVVYRSPEYEAARADGDEDLLQELRQDEDHYQVRFYESDITAQRERDRLAAERPNGRTSKFTRQAMLESNEFIPFNLLNTWRQRLQADDDVTVTHLADALDKLYISALSEESARKSELRRDKVAGFDPDMVRSFTQHASSLAATISALRLNNETLGVLQQMRDLARDPDAPDAVRDVRQEMANEVLERQAIYVDPSPNPSFDKIRGATSLWMLLSSPSYYMQNATQPFMLTWPVLGARFGLAKAGREMMAAYKTIGKAWIPAMDGALTAITEETVPDENVRELFQELQRRGLMDVGIAADLGSFRNPRGVMGSMVNNVHRKLIHGVRTVELFNRGVTAAAAFRMELAKNGGDVDAAKSYAIKAVLTTQGDYSDQNAPRIIEKLPMGKVITQFRKFQLVQLGILVRSVHGSFKGASPEERWMARKQLAYILGTHGAVGGLMGLPAANIIGPLIAAAVGDEDEPDDIELRVRRAINDPTAADLILRGLPAAAGLDVSARLGMGQTFSVLPYTDIEFTRAGWAQLVAGLMGPSTALAGQAVDGLGQVMEGNTWLGVAQMMPRVIRDSMRSYAYATEGVRRRNPTRDLAISPDELSAIDLFMQGLGLPTTALTGRMQVNRWLNMTEENFSSRAQELQREYIQAAGSERIKLRREWRELQNWRREYGFNRQSMRTLTDAPRKQLEREGQVVGGVATRSSNRRFVESLVE